MVRVMGWLVVGAAVGAAVGCASLGRGGARPEVGVYDLASVGGQPLPVVQRDAFGVSRILGARVAIELDGAARWSLSTRRLRSGRDSVGELGDRFTRTAVYYRRRDGLALRFDEPHWRMGDIADVRLRGDTLVWVEQRVRNVPLSDAERTWVFVRRAPATVATR
ncbi:MAG TPA: hypothetical protein VKA84_03515 [Gemmatimonadaceae bacterium]|nr:hypothetical protein [Gemmatimonadaceae bacterium]